MKITIRHGSTEVIVDEGKDYAGIHLNSTSIEIVIKSICENVIKLQAQKNEGVSPMQTAIKERDIAKVKTENKLDLSKKEGYMNRHVDGMPRVTKNTTITVMIEGIERDMDCLWIPSQNIGKHDYIGTAIVNSGEYAGLGFNAWTTTNDEFVHYK